MYTAFAGVYDRLMEQVDYAAWAAHYAALMREMNVPDKGNCVECACGTGNITLPLRKSGYRMTGVDLSEDMLRAAMEKARSAGLSVPFVCQDMTRLSVPRRVDCVLCTCDGVNYLTEPKQALQFFSAAHAALKPGGALIFDVSTPDKLQNTLGGHTLFCDEEDVAYIWHNDYREKTALLRMRLTIFQQRPDGAFERFSEEQCQRAHSREELTAWLTEAGFEDVRFFGRLRMNAPKAGDDRWHIAARKPMEESDK